MDDRQTPHETAPSRPRVFREILENLSPGYFALTMGTGIVSIGLHEAGWDLLSGILLAFAVLSYAVLWVLYIWRAIAFQTRDDFAASASKSQRTDKSLTISVCASAESALR